ncbi:multidrug ABC transporter ATP-binding protein [Clostridium tetani]|uniref:ABC transporter ATP-binding protein n=1 Tax=Clostridium tetani TaxID=1513 RepID=UPI000E14905F|nr:ABC transporter ATP-binding protein [Clostridium tetani]WFN62273.1 ABC transporter ATP-binding protein [Clostridium tetani]SUY54448.1 multidrug resistance ABC transporter [Clostridium tetani]BDR68841.1 multidrug ABC transporter ATP-binding protein [Clostridium tetani]BDR77321.1 multidrug ABC transporter ATP-binding protein [Clostridium tetani]BDR82842.1 multidrug ABC transporter ATP-binding protein [Clostridium tetani]
MSKRKNAFRSVKKAKDTKGTVKRIWQYLKKENKKALWMVVFLVLVTSVLGILGPYFIGVAIDKYIAVKNLKGTIYIIAILAIIYILTSIFTWIQTYIMVIVSQRTIKDIRGELFSKLQKLSLKFFDNNAHGDIMSRATNDIDNLNNALTQGVVEILTGIITIVGVIIAMFLLNPIMALSTLIIIPIMFFITKYLGKLTKKSFVERQQILGDLNGLIEETIGGQDIIALFNREEYVFNKFEEKNNMLKGKTTKAEILSGAMRPIMNFINNLGFALVVAIGGILTLKGMATIGIIASFVNYSRQFSRPLNQLASLYNTIQSAIAGGERVFEIIDEVPDIEDKDSAIEIESLKGEVDFINVNFEYKEDTPILKNINFQCNSGETIALVGPTGSGKTTIINLLTRFYDINNGDIKIDNLDIKEYNIKSLRNRVGVVLQDTYLFSGTIKDNIRYGRLDATDEEIIEAAKLANAHSFIKHLPKKYDTIVTSQGENLSHGQRQLLSIARVILSNPDILILDEATSNIDTRTELQIQKGLKNLMKGRTSFVIAHRLKTIEEADKILVIKNGEIIERGSHETLMQDQGFYHNLYVSQFKI